MPAPWSGESGHWPLLVTRVVPLMWAVHQPLAEALLHWWCWRRGLAVKRTQGLGHIALLGLGTGGVRLVVGIESQLEKLEIGLLVVQGSLLEAAWPEDPEAGQEVWQYRWEPLPLRLAAMGFTVCYEIPIELLCLHD